MSEPPPRLPAQRGSARSAEQSAEGQPARRGALTARVTRLPSASVALLVSPCVMLQPSARIAAPPMSSPPEKIFTRDHPGGSFQRKSPAGHAARKAPIGHGQQHHHAPVDAIREADQRVGEELAGVDGEGEPTGRSPMLDDHQPAAMSTPTAAPVTCHGHLPCCGRAARAEEPDAAHDPEHDDHEPRRDAERGRERRRRVADRDRRRLERWRAAGRGCRASRWWRPSRSPAG